MFRKLWVEFPWFCFQCINNILQLIHWVNLNGGSLIFFAMQTLPRHWDVIFSYHATRHTVALLCDLCYLRCCGKHSSLIINTTNWRKANACSSFHYFFKWVCSDKKANWPNLLYQHFFKVAILSTWIQYTYKWMVDER